MILSKRHSMYTTVLAIVVLTIVGFLIFSSRTSAFSIAPGTESECVEYGGLWKDRRVGAAGAKVGEYCDMPDRFYKCVREGSQWQMKRSGAAGAASWICNEEKSGNFLPGTESECVEYGGLWKDRRVGAAGAKVGEYCDMPDRFYKCVREGSQWQMKRSGAAGAASWICNEEYKNTGSDETGSGDGFASDLNLDHDVKCEGSTNILPCYKKKSGSGVKGTTMWGTMLMVINILSGGVVILMFAGIVYGAFLYTTAGGSQEQLRKSYGVFTNTAIGFLLYAVMWSLIQWLIPGGVIG